MATAADGLILSLNKMGTSINKKIRDKVAAAEKGGIDGVAPLNTDRKVPDIYLNPDLGKPGPAGPATYDFHNFINGKPLPNEVMLRAVACRTTTFEINFGGSYAFCTTAPTSAVVLEVLKNGVRIGTITYSPGATNAVFAASTALSLSSSDQLAVRNTRQDQDATWSDPTIVIKGTANT